MLMATGANAEISLGTRKVCSRAGKAAEAAETYGASGTNTPREVRTFCLELCVSLPAVGMCLEAVPTPVRSLNHIFLACGHTLGLSSMLTPS